MLQRGGDLALVQARAVVAIDRERDPATAVDVPRPAEGEIFSVPGGPTYTR